jgi:hypothetical protein
MKKTVPFVSQEAHKNISQLFHGGWTLEQIEMAFDNASADAWLKKNKTACTLEYLTKPDVATKFLNSTKKDKETEVPF